LEEISMLRTTAIALALTTACLASAASAADLPTKKAISVGGGHTIIGLSVDGEAEDVVKPDVAVLSLEAVDDLPTAAAASARNAVSTSDIVSALKGLGVGEADIRTEAFDLTPFYRERPVANGGEGVERVLAGYRASTMVRARMRNVDEAPKIARAIFEGGSDAYRGLTFFVADHDARFEALRIKAMADAARRAKVYSESAAMTLCQVLDVTPGAGSNAGRSERDLPGRRGDSAQGAISIPTAVEPEVLRADVVLTWALPPARPDSCDPAPDNKPGAN
jgi:uncharacterized protein YggE